MSALLTAPLSRQQFAFSATSVAAHNARLNSRALPLYLHTCACVHSCVPVSMCAYVCVRVPASVAHSCFPYAPIVSRFASVLIYKRPTRPSCVSLTVDQQVCADIPRAKHKLRNSNRSQSPHRQEQLVRRATHFRVLIQLQLQLAAQFSYKSNFTSKTIIKIKKY